MLDHPRKTKPLMAMLKAALPFEIEIAPAVVANLRADHPAIADNTPYPVKDVLYAGDEGGIMCAIILAEEKEGLVISLTFVRNVRPAKLAAAILDYQKHRRKKLRKEGHPNRALDEPTVIHPR